MEVDSPFINKAEMEEDRLYLSMYQGSVGVVWVKDGEYFFHSNEQPEKSVGADEPDLLVLFPLDAIACLDTSTDS